MFGVQICTWAPFGTPLPNFDGKKTKAAAWPKNMVVTRDSGSLGMCLPIMSQDKPLRQAEVLFEDEGNPESTVNGGDNQYLL